MNIFMVYNTMTTGKRITPIRINYFYSTIKYICFRQSMKPLILLEKLLRRELGALSEKFIQEKQKTSGDK